MKFKAHGKWILAGEHAVLRGSPALVFPIESLFIELTFEPTADPLHVEFAGERGGELKLIGWGLLENAAERCGRTLRNLNGRITLNSNLPLGSGLGASAALCVVVSKWLEKSGWIHSDDLYEFSRGLEDLFHGESSGVDIAVALSQTGLRFVRGGDRSPLKMNWRPKFYLSYCGHRGVTAECVEKVKQLFASDPKLAAKLDEQMRQSVALSEEALRCSESEGMGLLVEAIGMAADCFDKWSLIDENLQKHMSTLKARGARAVKPTGSGGGGYVLSLWDFAPQFLDMYAV